MQISDQAVGPDGRAATEEGPHGPDGVDRKAKPAGTHTQVFCERCQHDVEVTSKQRFVGGEGGGMTSQAVCPVCSRVLGTAVV
jgi:hypothetical protein